MKKYDVVKIEWVDSSHSEGWQTTVELISDLRINTVGYYWQEKKDSIIILQSFAKDERCFDAVLTIPKVSIIKIKKLK